MSFLPLGGSSPVVATISVEDAGTGAAVLLLRLLPACLEDDSLLSLPLVVELEPAVEPAPASGLSAFQVLKFWWKDESQERLSRRQGSHGVARDVHFTRRRRHVKQPATERVDLGWRVFGLGLGATAFGMLINLLNKTCRGSFVR